MYRCLLMKQVLAELSECFICWFCNDIFVCKCIMSNHDKQRRRPSLVLQATTTTTTTAHPQQKYQPNSCLSCISNFIDDVCFFRPITVSTVVFSVDSIVHVFATYVALSITITNNNSLYKSLRKPKLFRIRCSFVRYRERERKKRTKSSEHCTLCEKE